MKTELELFHHAEQIYHQYNEDRYPEAIAAFQLLLAHHPKNVKGWHMLSTMQACNQDFDDAIQSIDRAIQLDKGGVRLWRQKHTLLSKISRFDFREGIFFDPETQQVVELITFQSPEHIQQEIIFVCDAIIGLVPGDYFELGSLYENKGEAYALLADWDKAIAAYKAAIEVHKISEDDFELTNCHVCIAKLYEAVGDYEKALQWYDTSLELKFEEILLPSKASILKKLGKVIEAEQLYNEFTQLVVAKLEETLDAAYMFQLSTIYQERGLLPEAIQILIDWEAKVRQYKGLKEYIAECKAALSR